MIDLFLSSDGKHTVHVSAETPEELAELAPKAKALYEKIIESYGNKAQMWQLAIDKEPARLKNAREIPARAENSSGMAPICPMHNKPMKMRQGKYGSFWSCAVRNPNGLWCQVTKETDSHGDEQKATA
jgi:transposase-like protein